ncbi:secretin N-terminal domain-containing protein [Pontiellaceae bacterium B12219]|nr:secretin N-terminal domain-containing protein [Pontiellaceae bacterium B12219]
MKKQSFIIFTAMALAAIPLYAQTNTVSAPRIVAAPIDSLDPTDEVGPIVLRKMSTDQVFELLQTYSGRVIIPAAGLPKTTFTFNSSEKMRRDEAILAIETLLNLNGILLVPQKNGFLEAIPHNQALRHGPILHDGAVPESSAEQQVYGRIFELTHLDSKSIYQQIRNLLSPGGLATILNLEWRNSLLIFDTDQNLDALATVIKMLDQPAGHRAEVYVIPIKNSRVYSVYYALLHAQRYRANAALFRARFHIDSAANHLVVVSSPESKPYIEELVEKLDREIAPLTTSQVYTIEKGNLRTIYSILTGMIRHQQSQFGKRGFQSLETYRISQKLNEADTLTETEPVDTPPVETVVSEIAADAASTAELQFSPYMGVWLDYQNNALVAYGTPADLRRMGELIKKLDRETAPYTSSEIIKLKHAYAAGLGSLLNHMVSVQRNLFSRQGLSSGEARDGQGSDVADDAFEFSPYMYIWTERANNAIVVYGTRSDIDRIKSIIAQMDVQQAPVTRSKTITIQNTQAITVANMIGRIISMQRSMFKREGVFSGKPREDGTTPGEGGAMEVGFEFTPYAMVTADRTGNSLFVYGTEQDIQRVEELLVDLDRETAPITKSKVYYLKHAEAYSLSRIISQVITSQRRIFDRRGLRSGEETASSDAEMNMGFEFSEFATIVADRRSNSLLFYGTDSDIIRIDAMIAETDIAVEPITGSRVFPLKHAEANSLSRVLQLIVTSQRRAMKSVESASEKVRNSQEGSDAPNAEGDLALQFSPFLSIVPDARNNALIVYGTHGDLKHVASLVEQTDVEVAPLTRSQVFFLENAKANTLSSILTRMIRSQQTAMRLVQSRFRAVQYPGEENDNAGAMLYDPNQSMQFSPYVSVVPNDRNNSLLIYGTEEDIRQLDAIISQNDIAVAPRTQSRIFYIRHADANDVVRTINPLITSQQRVREREATLRRFYRKSGGDLDDELLNDELEPQGGEALAEMPDVGMEFDEDLQFSPYVTLSADDRSNSILVYGTPFDLEQVENLIDRIDRVLPQVQIEVVIAEVMLENGQVSGLDSFGVSYDNPFPFQVAGAAAGGVASRGGVLGQTGEIDAGEGAAGDIGLGLNPFSLQMVFRTAKEDGKVRILSAPTITTSHNRPASINVGEARPIITSSTSTLNNNNTSRSTVEYRDIGIELKVVPLVSDQGYIQMDIEQTVETVIGSQTIDNNEQPIIGTRRANSFVSVRDQQIIVMGGLQSETTIVTDGKVWILGDIPLIGRLFRPKKNVSTVRELIIFIRPQLITDSSTQEMMKQLTEEPGLAAEDALIYLENNQFAGQLARIEEEQESVRGNTNEVTEVIVTAEESDEK